MLHWALKPGAVEDVTTGVRGRGCRWESGGCAGDGECKGTPGAPGQGLFSDLAGGYRGVCFVRTECPREHRAEGGLCVLTWGVDQSHMVPDAQSCLLHQGGGHPLCPFVQLDTGCSAGNGALGKWSGDQHGAGGWGPLLGHLCAHCAYLVPGTLVVRARGQCQS